METFKFEQSIKGIVNYLDQFIRHHNYSPLDIHLKVIPQEEEIDKFEGVNFLFDNNSQLKEVLKQVIEIVFVNNSTIKLGMLNYIDLSKDNVARFYFKWENHSQF